MRRQPSLLELGCRVGWPAADFAAVRPQGQARIRLDHLVFMSPLVF